MSKRYVIIDTWDITVYEREEGWIAYLTNTPQVWEAGKSIEEAIGKLVISLSQDLSDE